MVDRNISSSILTMLDKYPVISLTGPRQAGKSTLLKHLLPNYHYVSLEDPDMMDFALEDPRDFLNQYSEKVILDEVQRAPKLLSYIQTIVDEQKIMGQFILSGSQNFILLEKISQSLAGRVALFYLLPFSLAELSKSNLIADDPDQSMFHGFYPAIFDRKIPPQQYYPNYIETYVERDVRNLINVKDLNNFRRFVRLCAGRAGQLLNVSELAIDSGVSQTTANSWLSVLEASFIIYRLQPYFKNFNKRLIKSSKLYFYDTGLAAYLLGIKEPGQMTTHYLRGHLFENMVISDLIKQAHNSGQKTEFYFYRDSNNNEIDCLYEVASKLNLIEIKSGKTITKDYTKGIESFKKMAPEVINEMTIIYGGDQYQQRKGVSFLPWNEMKSMLG